MDKIKYLSYKNVPPRYLYKYYRNLNYLKDVIQNKRIHLDYSSSFNDIFDGARIVQPSDFIGIECNDLLKQTVVRYSPDWCKHSIESLINASGKELNTLYELFHFLRNNGIPEKVVGALENTLLALCRNMHLDNFKISCFTESNDSLLMWAHYGDKLAGGCLCFDTYKDPALFSNLHKINYSRYRSKDDGFNYYYCKSEEWAYEQEWRIITENYKQEFINTNSCVGVILGERLPWAPSPENNRHYDVYMWEIHALAAQNHLAVYDARADKEEYKINIINRHVKSVKTN